GVVGGLDLRQAHDPALGLRDRLLGDDEHVAVLEGGTAGDQLSEVVTLVDLGQAFDREDPDQGKPVSRRPAVMPYSRFTFRITAVIDSRAREFSRGPASTALPPTRPSASSSAGCLARGSPQTSASSSGGSAAATCAAESDCRPEATGALSISRTCSASE